MVTQVKKPFFFWRVWPFFAYFGKKKNLGLDFQNTGFGLVITDQVLKKG